MQNAKILLGISGGIAAYRACDLARDFIKQGAQVRVVMTKNACKFITPYTLQILTNNTVHTDLFEEETPREVFHIEIAKWADIALIAPATANIIGKIAAGIADDLLTTIVMALPQNTPVAFAPAMNVEMWNNPIVQKNINFLKSLKKYHFIEPTEGLLACGDVGKGKIADNDVIISEMRKLLF
ncbi:MAG: bifunctional phosphopantothenoylcysteine decarboxylase/phosphopantothenate--cysteine ligase CoaBC [Spirochaetes bacterium]|nr:bifunctional phosphopantothenoylcysteine decarboxylase/phosphopantothenate--cysteine ligase CoaBC [Spirochaetota bacterium]